MSDATHDGISTIAGMQAGSGGSDDVYDWLREILTAPVYDVARRTPLEAAPRLSKRIKNAVWLKREDLQPVFSFKLRGAYNRMRKLTPEEKARGVLAVSAGNHAQGAALAARELGVDVVIVMPVTTPQIKVSSVDYRVQLPFLHCARRRGLCRHAIDRRVSRA